MGKVAKALGLNVKGSLDVVLDRTHYVAGDLMQGSVVLSVAEPLDFTSLVLRIQGKELVTWTEGGGQTASVYLREHFHLQEEIVLTAGQESIQPGEYVYPICFQLSDALPDAFHISNRNAGVMCRIDASLSYSATAVMAVKGSFAADLEAKRPFVVQQPPVGHPVSALEASSSGDVHVLRLMNKGKCSVSAALPSNVHVAGDTLLVQTTVQNDSTKKMSKLSVMLIEDLTMDLGSSQKPQGEVCVTRREFPGLAAGKTLEQVLDLPLTTLATPSRPVPAAIQSHFLSTRYRLVVKCHFRLCRSVSVDFPVVILRKVVVRNAATAFAPSLAAVAVEASPAVVAAAAAARKSDPRTSRTSRTSTASLNSVQSVSITRD
ncbi:hypothetical protein PHYBOEH_010890 [Phytophthora boehmeriae]|uniref:Arrestin C-terminal-like domain-containing protein n=1 Tax=Phytophthora boehmeriae TaxID=109152 RepID=A0A8T1WYJ5_9STRA|nr:hypothetical protein PHYBOEH_010890 [Phytophthora boehmeriae]